MDLWQKRYLEHYRLVMIAHGAGGVCPVHYKKYCPAYLEAFYYVHNHHNVMVHAPMESAFDYSQYTD